MTGLEVQVLERRLDRLAELTALLRSDRSEAEKIAYDADVRDRVERRLQLAAQVAIDVSNYLIARFRWPRSSRETLWDVLARERVIAPSLAEELRGLSGFRNVLVHEYLGIDLDIVTNALLHDVGQLEDFRARVLDFLEAQQ
jgi:uncharacterized protein YutE (UPF0331/DUF86 family)